MFWHWYSDPKKGPSPTVRLNEDLGNAGVAWFSSGIDMYKLRGKPRALLKRPVR